MRQKNKPVKNNKKVQESAGGGSVSVWRERDNNERTVEEQKWKTWEKIVSITRENIHMYSGIDPLPIEKRK